MGFKYSIMIPTLNEEYFLEKNLQRLKSFHEDFEIIVSDAGSTNKTLSLAQLYDSKIVNSEAGRGIQLNAGAAAATGEILIFLHADTFLPDDAFKLMDEFFSSEKKRFADFYLDLILIISCLIYILHFQNMIHSLHVMATLLLL